MANEEHLAILKQGVDAWNEWRYENTRVYPDLRGAELDGVDLNAANLWYAYLHRANLREANLRGADLYNANLSGAFLSGANLNGANLHGANLHGADLTGADLTGANLHGTNLTGANLNRARIGWTVFSNVDLNEVIELQSIKHEGPSTIGIDTVYKSGGNIPEAFLRGCGVPENFITFHKSLVNSPIEFYSCFISYSHEDKSFARRLHDQLQMRGIRCWLDEKQMLPGDDIYEQVDRGIRLWDKVLLCASKHSLSSWWVNNEIDTAFEKERQMMKDRQERILALIPLNLDGYMFNGQWKSGKEKAIKSRLAADFTGWEADNTKFEEQFELVVKALQTGNGGREQPPPPKL